MKIALGLACLLFITGCSHLVEMSRTPEDGYGYMNSGIKKTHIAGKWQGGKLNGFGYEKRFNKREQFFGSYKNGLKNGYISQYDYYEKTKDASVKNITYYQNGVKKGDFQENHRNTFHEGFNFTGGSFYFVKDNKNKPISLVIKRGSDRRSYRSKNDHISELYDYRQSRDWGKYKESIRRCFDGSLSAGGLKSSKASFTLGQGLVTGKYENCDLLKQDDEKETTYFGLIGINNKEVFSYGFKSTHESGKKLESKRFGPTIEFHPDGLVKSIFYKSDKPHGYSLEYKKRRNEFLSDEIYSKGTHPLNKELREHLGSLTKYKTNEDKLKTLEGKAEDKIIYEDPIELISSKEVEAFFDQTPRPFGFSNDVKVEMLKHYEVNPISVSRLVKQLRPYYTYHTIQSIYKIPMSGVDLVEYKNGKEVSRKNISLKKCGSGSTAFYISGSCEQPHRGLRVEKDLMSYKVNYNEESKVGFVSSTYMFPFKIYGDYKEGKQEGIRYNLAVKSYDRYKKYQIELGVFKRNQLVGSGLVYSSSEKVLQYPKGFYQGEVSNNLPNGKGKVFRADPNKYTQLGTFKSGVINGEGRSKIGLVDYRGNFLNGKRDGKFKTYFHGKYVDTWNYSRDRRKDKKGKCVSNVRDSKGKYTYKVTPCEYKNGKRVDKAYLAQVKIEREIALRKREEEAYRRRRQREEEAQERERRREKKRRRLAKKRKYRERLERQRQRSSSNRSSTFSSSSRIDPNKFLKSRLGTSSTSYRVPKKVTTSYYKNTNKTKKKNVGYVSVQKKQSVRKRYKDDTIEIQGTHSMFQPYDTALDLAKTNARTRASESCRSDGGILNKRQGYLINKKCNPNKSGKEYKCTAKMNFWCTVRVQ